MGWIENINKKMEESRSDKKEQGLTINRVRRMDASAKGGLAQKGKKHTEETKNKWSNSKIGKKRDKDSVQRSIEGSKKTKFLQLLERYPKEYILAAQTKYDNHQHNICIELGASISTLRKLCKHYELSVPKKSNEEKTEWARENQSKAVIAYHYDKLKDNGKGEIIGEYYSIAEAARELKIAKCRGHIIAVLNKKRPHTNKLYFEYKN